MSKSKHNPHKTLLIQKSVEAKQIIKSRIANAANDIDALAAATLRINEILLEIHQKESGATDFRTLPDWNKAGYKISKNSKAFRIWGTPRRGSNKVEATKVSSGETETIEQQYRFFPMCCLYNENQVEKVSETEF